MLASALLAVGSYRAAAACAQYTASNGAPSTPESLHYISSAHMNEYQTAIQTVGEILLVRSCRARPCCGCRDDALLLLLQEYDSDKRVPVYGFGGAFQGQTHHIFPLTFDPSHPGAPARAHASPLCLAVVISCVRRTSFVTEVDGVPGVMEAYRNSLSFVSLSGPTKFSHIIAAAAAEAAKPMTQESLHYTVLLIITDGESCRAVPCRAVPCRAVPCRAVPCRAVPCRAGQRQQQCGG